MQNLTQSERAQSWLSDKDKRANIYFMSAKYDVDDEFYTSFDEIRAEMQDYRTHFKGKVVVCPCNDGKKSNFYRYFALNFKSLELKKLITTTYNVKEPRSKGMKIEISESGINETMLQGDGDFRSKEVRHIIASGDIIVTNPPFSLFRDLIEIVEDEIKDKYPELVKHTYKENNTKSAVLRGQELFTRIIIQRKGGLKPRARILNQF